MYWTDATSTDARTQQPSLEYSVITESHKVHKKQAAVDSTVQHDRSARAIITSKPPVENDLRGIGAQFDAYRDGTY
ncbi:hypothetical protein J7T55_003689 [Diaporthe amygdali]|uniref:uncharacterized protein n=1 Tax=Phomopsis amygdali TaxID=1214568 RepID=UPI0022FE1621|nr:uncharacterized protein J7T55_003689 [Diaporthe amygdali]KAJ0117278.1 hypothetical protein J7T55_003689 [Diaporthe amygdali]